MSGEQHLEPKSKPGGLFDENGNPSQDIQPTHKKEVTTQGSTQAKSEPQKEELTEEGITTHWKNEPQKEKSMTTKPEEKKTPQKAEPKSQAPTKQENKSNLSLDKINRMSINNLVKAAPKDRFIQSIAGSNPTEKDYSDAEKIFSREASFALRAFSENSYLKKVAENNKLSVINAMIDLGNSGLSLSPVLKQGYFVPMDKKVLFWASYMGKRDIVMASGQVKDAYARLVYEGEEFEVKYGTGGHIKHTPDPWGDKDPSKIKGGYWYCVLSNGAEKFGTMNKQEIEAIQKRAPSAGASTSPWKSDWEQMALKTVFNRGFKEMPKGNLSDQQIKALEVGDQLEEKDVKNWIKQRKVKQDSFDDDYEDDNSQVEDAQIV